MNIAGGNSSNNNDRNNVYNDKDNDNIEDLQMIIPSTYENLIELVSDNGDNYEEKLRQSINQMHPVLW